MRIRVLKPCLLNRNGTLQHTEPGVILDLPLNTAQQLAGARKVELLEALPEPQPQAKAPPGYLANFMTGFMG